MRILLAILVLTASAAVPAAADDGPPYRATTPRASVAEEGGWTRLGIPGGRAWGLESPLRRAPRGPGAVAVDLAVTDPAVREAFVRVAWYARDAGRQRQLAVSDSEEVASGERRTVVVPLEPPDGAVAYRVRVLARLVPGAPRSADGAVVAGPPRALGPRLALTRLVRPDPL